MAETFESYLKRLMDKSTDASAKQASFEWYLAEIRRLAAQASNTKETAETKAAPTSGQAMDKAQAEKTKDATKSPADLREQVDKENVIETTTGIGRSMIGKMLFFRYDAKTKDKLPYWDQFPLIFPFSVRGNYMIGMNMHYLPPIERARLMYGLFTTINTETLDYNSKLAITYKMLNNSAKFENFRPCIKKYLGGHIRSRLSIINPKNWNQVVYMPLANFMKASEFKVWSDSVEKIRKASFKS